MTTPYDSSPRGQVPADDIAPPYASPEPVPAAPPQYSAGPPMRRDRPAAGFDDRGHVRRGRASALWISLVAGAIGLILLIIFIAQNSKTVAIHFLGLSGHLSVGLTVLIAAVVGLLLAAVPGTARILQLRRALKKNTPKGQRTP